MTTRKTSTVTVTEHPRHWATLRIDIPPLNLLDHRVYGELAVALERFESDPEIHVVVLESADPEFFSAHFDVSLTPEQAGRVGPALATIMRALRSPRLVSIAKMRGRARGGGNELALLCDMRFGAAESLIIGQPEVTLRLFPGGGAAQLLPALIGRARALELILGGHNIDAATAERYGVINRAIPDRDLDEYVDTLAARIAEFDSVALEHAKAAVDRRYLPPIVDFELDVAAFRNLLRSPETSAVIRDALAAGLQTRGPYEYDFGN
ncbi:enoyl-CoA hydratase/isomerase family protein [Nocardia wallacei]|uniref:enoyl-CoA hydratase/isomerase family protein n=1 Tax=Nocardia wallacei TaxID=480035 RepID=UPI00245400CE|nr:enoyl-CoA hydratase/isomerase family protein [Nocardia wallacei]